MALDAGRLAPGLRLTWVNPETARAWRGRSASEGQLQAPDGQDWLLILR